MRIVFSERLDVAATADGNILRVICPWLTGLPPETGPWLSALPISDVNAFTDDEAPTEIPGHLADSTYFGVFALDRFRQPARIFSKLRAKGIRRIINVPSVSFFDGQSAEIFETLGFSWSEEVEFLRRAAAAGLRSAVCGRAPVVLAREDADIFDFAVEHDGPGSQFIVHPARRPASADEAPGLFS